MFHHILWILLFLQTSAVLQADSSYWDTKLVRPYVHYSELQRHWAWSFMASHLKDLKGDEHCLDVGCGDGRITADVSKFVPHGFVLGIDLARPMIEWAKKQYHPLDYPNLNFQEGNFLDPNVQGHFDRILSFCALQHCSDLQTALKNLARLLKPDGQLLVLVPAMQNAAWNKARAIVQSLPQWKEYWSGFAPRKFLTTDQYRTLLEACELLPIKIEFVQTRDPFVDKKEMLDWMKGTFAPVVPKAEAENFYNDWIEEYLKLDPQAINEEGVIEAKLGYITLEAMKN